MDLRQLVMPMYLSWIIWCVSNGYISFGRAIYTPYLATCMLEWWLEPACRYTLK